VSETARIVIIGGGIVGTSIAYHLAKRGAAGDVIVLEKHRLASGTTAAAVGGIRSQFSTEINIQFSLESVRFWRRWDEEIGLPLDYREDGYIFLAQTDDEAEIFRRNVTLQNSMGVASRLLTRAEATELMPGLFVDDLTALAYNATDGRATPHEATMGYAKRARELGVRIREGVEVTGIAVRDGRVRGVDTNDGTIATEIVVNAAGPWSGLVGRLAGVDVPVKPYRREIFISEPFDQLPPRFPNIIDLHVGWYFWREGAGILMSGMKDSHSSFDTHVNWAGLSHVAEFATHRHPALAHAHFGKRAYAGLYDVSPDDHAILGATPEVGGFFLACGFSGHGFQHSPATGRVMAELILDGRTTGIDIAPLAVTRFATGALLREPLTAHAGTMSG
jgi:sarcosine oxidase subunit beta